MKYNYLFGPVLSRRLGLSLGVDLIPEKYCSMDCVYCEIGKTSTITLERKEYFPAEEIEKELKHYLSQKPKLDFITFSGAGEPTLNKGIGEIISYLNREFPGYKTALITNSSLFAFPEVRKEVTNIDLILPSLDAVSQEVFQKINRPCPSLKTAAMIEGLAAYRQESSAQMWLEIFILPGINDTEEEISLLQQAVAKIEPDRVQLNTLDRPGTEKWVQKEPYEILEKIAVKFAPFKTEIISRKTVNVNIDQMQTPKLTDGELLQESIIATLRRRPCTLDELNAIFANDTQTIQNELNALSDAKKIACEQRDSDTFFYVI